LGEPVREVVAPARLLALVEVAHRLREVCAVDAELGRERAEARGCAALEGEPRPRMTFLRAPVLCGAVRYRVAVASLGAEPIPDGGDGQSPSDDDDRGPSPVRLHASRLSRPCRR